jgi:putative FmdB family regulatory protein
MPTYDYVCDACGHEFEEFQSITADSLKKCPECKKSKLRRLIGAGAGILFRGSGFYETDYRSASYKKGAEAERKATEPAKDSKDSKDSKPDKTDAKAGGAAKDKKPAAAKPTTSSKAKPAKEG